MSPGDFLRSVWPGDGLYCLMFRGRKADGEYWHKHRVFKSIGDVEQVVLAERTRPAEIYFAVHTLKEHDVPHQSHPDKRQVRVQRNMRAARAFFYDLDVGSEDHKYHTQADALAALKDYCTTTQLPKPLVVNSGGGLHVYWLIDQAIDSDEWRVTAQKLRQLANHYGLKVDPARTTDTSSVLRVVGTYNRKRDASLDVVALTPAKPTPAGVFLKLVEDAMIRAGVEAKAPPRWSQLDTGLLGSNTASIEFDGPPLSAAALLTACAQMRRLAELKGKFSEPEWMWGAIGVGRFLKDGHRRAHQFSKEHPEYTEAACNAKIKQHSESGYKPTSCEKIAEVSGVGDSLCIGCPFQGKVVSPLGAARFKELAPAPVVIDEAAEVTITIPDPPPPFARVKGSGVTYTSKNAAGDETVQTIYEYDLYPVRRLTNRAAGFEQQMWHVELPHGESKEFSLDADALYDMRKFVMAITHSGMYPAKNLIPALQDYMVAYISQLQRLTEADAQCAHLGWAQDYKQFILPDKILLADGTAKSATLSTGAERSSQNVGRKGSRDRQIELLKFYDHPNYLPNQAYLMCGLAAPLFHMTGHHGVIVNASGDAGASKSTSLYSAASFWGAPDLYPINGTNNGATVRGRNERVTVLANLPVCVDEITHMPVKDAVDLAMSITQPGHRIRLGTDGVERASTESYKATIMLTTANNSLHSQLSTDNSAGTAGSMRVFEIPFRAGPTHKKWEADEYLHALKENYGHLGEVFIRYVMKNYTAVEQRVRAKVREIDIAADIKGAERFWSALGGVVLVTTEIAYELGIVPFIPSVLQQWLLNRQIPYMRGVVATEYSDALSILADYLELVNADILVTSKSTSPAGTFLSLDRKPRGSLVAHYDKSREILYVLKQSFKDHCQRTGANATKLIQELVDQRIVLDANKRRVLGAGTDYAKAQSWCFMVNMAHASVSGSVVLDTIEGDSREGGMQGNLRVVQ